MRVPPIPEGFHTTTPNVVIEGVEKEVEFYKQAFGAEEKVRLTTPDGKIVHSELRIGDSCLNIGEAMEGWPAHPLLAQIFVEDSDAVFERAVSAGAKVIRPMTDMFFGSREGRVADCLGGTWTISTRNAAPAEYVKLYRLGGGCRFQDLLRPARSGAVHLAETGDRDPNLSGDLFDARPIGDLIRTCQTIDAG
jgi:PhnB protein